MFTWNHKSSKKDSGLRSPKKDHSLKKPSINIIGCLQSTELILAQADQRMRHQQETMELRQRKCEEKVRQIDEAIQLKYTRAERYAAILEMKQRQATWLKIVKALNYLSIVSTEVKHHFKVGMFFSHTVHAALVIKRACKRFMRRHLVHKFNYKFMVLFRKREFVFRLATRIKRKEIAMNRIKTFLTEYRNHHRVRFQLSLCVGSIQAWAVCKFVVLVVSMRARDQCGSISSWSALRKCSSWQGMFHRWAVDCVSAMCHAPPLLCLRACPGPVNFTCTSPPGYR